MNLSFPDNRKTVLWIVAAGLALRLLVLFLCLDTPLFGDAHAYHKFALMYLNGESFDTIRAPGLSLWLTSWYTVFGASQVSSMLSILPFHLVLSATLYIYTTRLVNTRSALIALALISFYPSFVFHSIWPLTQIPMAAALLLALFLLDSKPTPFRVIAAGLLLGFAILLRPNCVVLVPVLGLITVLRNNHRAFLSASLLMAVSLFPALLWSAREYRYSGNLVFINYTNSMNLYLGNNRFTPLYKTWWFGSHGRGSRDVPTEFSNRLRAISEIPISARNKVYLNPHSPYRD
jgi:4-amino-4-deoxy-L-arabinose transferase-like glycosyltransferase